MHIVVSGFDWDAGNLGKCQKHGVSSATIEDLFTRAVMVVPDIAHADIETRLRAIGKDGAGRYVFLVFTIRERGGRHLIRPISARYMHRKEVASYEEENPDLSK
jgi:uncharacterized DUF497 family protein